MRGCRAAAHAKGFQLSVAIVLLLLSACALSPASGYGADSNVDGYGGKDDISEGMKTGADDSAVGYVFRFCDSCGYMTFTGSSSNDAILLLLYSFPLHASGPAKISRSARPSAPLPVAQMAYATLNHVFGAMH